MANYLLNINSESDVIPEVKYAYNLENPYAPLVMYGFLAGFDFLNLHTRARNFLTHSFRNSKIRSTPFRFFDFFVFHQNSKYDLSWVPLKLLASNLVCTEFS